MWRVLRSAVAVYSVSAVDISPFLTRAAIRLNTLHGLPIRNGSSQYLRHHAERLDAGWKRWLVHGLSQIYQAVRVDGQADYALTSSVNVHPIWQRFFNYRPGQMKPLGIPRNDYLFGEQAGSIRRDAEEKIISYLPTSRGSDAVRQLDVGDLFSEFGFAEDKFQQFLETHNARLVVKPHHRQAGLDKIRQLMARCDRITLCEDGDVMPVLKDTDILVTDYSSVIFNFLLLDRPVVLAPFDYDECSEGMGYTLDYKEFMPGPICRSWQEVLVALQEYMEKDGYAAARERARTFIYDHPDGHSRERVADFIGELVRAGKGAA
jgi:CDP-glycerol glycerophosphotransferase